MFLQPRGFKLSHSSSLIKVSVMEVLPYFFLISGDSNIVSQLTDLTFSHCMFFLKKLLFFQKLSGFEMQLYVKYFRTNV